MVERWGSEFELRMVEELEEFRRTQRNWKNWVRSTEPVLLDWMWPTRHIMGSSKMIKKGTQKTRRKSFELTSSATERIGGHKDDFKMWQWSDNDLKINPLILFTIAKIIPDRTAHRFTCFPMNSHVFCVNFYVFQYHLPYHHTFSYSCILMPTSLLQMVLV